LPSSSSTITARWRSTTFDTVSGAQGLTGAADTILILKPSANGVTLYARGPDIEEAELTVQFNRNNCEWTILAQAAEVHRSDERKIPQI
jgi:hypothetical protein